MFRLTQFALLLATCSAFTAPVMPRQVSFEPFHRTDSRDDCSMTLVVERLLCRSLLRTNFANNTPFYL